MDLITSKYSVPWEQADKAPEDDLAQYATDGDPARGIPATILSAALVNAIVSEIVNAIKTGGKTPDRFNWGQLAQVIKDLQGKIGSIEENGPYLKLNSPTLQTVGSEVTFNGNVGVTNHGVVIKTTDSKPNQDGWTLGYSLVYQLDDAGNQQVFTYAQRGPAGEIQYITAVKGQGKTGFYSYDNNGNIVCNGITTNDQVVNDILRVNRLSSVNGQDIGFSNKVHLQGQDLVLDSTNRTWGDNGVLNTPAIYWTCDPNNKDLFAAMYLTDYLNIGSSVQLNICDRVEFNFHDNGDLDANGDYFAKRREVADEANARENSDKNLQDNINGVQINLNNEAEARVNADNNLQTNLNNEANTRQNADNAIQTDANNKYNDLNSRKADRSQLPFPENMKVQLFSVFFARGISIWNNDANDYRLQTVNLPTAFTGGFHNVFCSTVGKTPPTLSVQIINNNQLNVGMHQTNYDYLVNDLTINFMAVGYY